MIILFTLIGLFVFFRFVFPWIHNPKIFPTVNIICGGPGTGKSTISAALALSGYKHKRKMFCNYEVAHSYLYNWDDFGFYDMSDASIILDEAGLHANNRDFKSFKKEALAYVKFLRHRGNNMFVLSQTWDDMDLKIRVMAATIWLVRRHPLFKRLIVMVPVTKAVGIDPVSHQIEDLYELPFLAKFFGRKLFYGPLYWKYFDSFEAPSLPEKKFDFIEYDKIQKKCVKR